MSILLIIVAIVLVSLVLLQSGKAEGNSGIFTGAVDSTFANRKERGGELFMTRLTYVTGVVFLALCFVQGF